MVLLEELSSEVSCFPLPVCTLPWLPTYPVRTSTQPAMPASEPSPARHKWQILHHPILLYSACTRQWLCSTPAQLSWRQSPLVLLRTGSLHRLSHAFFTLASSTQPLWTQLRWSPPHPCLLLPAEQSAPGLRLDGHRLCSADLSSLCSCCLLARTRL